MAKTKKAQTTVKFIGGVNKDRIGGNCSVIEHTDKNGNTDVVMFDLGSIFTPYETGFVAAMPNVDEYFDRIDPDTKVETKALKPVKALFITHAHEDHIGALINYAKMGYKLPPIKTSGFSRNFIRLAFREEGVSEPDIERIKGGETVKISENMEVKAVDVSHSIIDSLGFFTKTYDDGKPCAAIMNNGDFLTDEAMPVGKSFNKDSYINTLKSAKCPVLICLDSTSTSPFGKERIGFEQAVENTYNAIKRHPEKSVIISPVISRSVQNIAIDIEVARRLGTKVCLDGKWLTLVKDAMFLSGFNDFEDVLYKGNLKAFLADDKIKLKYIDNTGAFAQGLENYEYNVGVDEISPIPMSSATKMALDLHPVLRVDQKVLVLARQRIIDEINGKTGPKMLQMLAAQGATVVMSPSAQKVGNFEEVQMQDSGHVNATAIKALMKDVKSAVKDVMVIPIHGNPDQLGDTAQAMKEVGVESHLVGNKEGVHVVDGKISNIEPKLTPLTWYAVRSISPNPFSERDVPLEGLREFWEVTEDYEPIRKICEVANVQRFSPRDENYSNSHKLLEKADDMPRKEKMKSKKQKKKSLDMINIMKGKKGRKR
ncbi:MAG: MBL fold metallo-hydrolase [Alphaproteobacteria bacterium]|nr:MBL fold metallo-hydrolase [Alphaproteobacteria bacterium]